MAFCDEAYILMVQALDVKVLGKGRRRILTEQALRMARVGLGEGYPRHTTYISARLSQLARVVIEQLSPPSDEGRCRMTTQARMNEPSHTRSENSCWWLGCAEDATTLVTANDVTRFYCPDHAQHVEHYYASAARWEERHSHA